jgi:hypothetical protein
MNKTKNDHQILTVNKRLARVVCSIRGKLSIRAIWRRGLKAGTYLINTIEIISNDIFNE